MVSNLEWSQAEPFSKYEPARAFLDSLTFLQGICKEKIEIEILDFWLQNLLEDIMTRILNGHNVNLWAKMSVLERF